MSTPVDEVHDAQGTLLAPATGIFKPAERHAKA